MKWLLLILLLLIIGFVEELYRYLFCSKSSWLFTKLFDSKGHEEEYYVYRKKGEEKMKSLPQEKFTMESDGGEKLTGFYYPNGAGGKKIAFLIHGYRSDHADTGGIACDYYLSRGFDLFAVDHRACGESGGHFIGFDVLESQDCLKWLDYLKEKFGDDMEIVLHGFSMGAATVMQMSSHCPGNVKFIAEDSGYENAKASLAHQIGPMYSPLRILNKWIAGYDWNDSDVKASLSESRIPMLFFHGKEDKLVPFENGTRLYDFYQGPKDCFFPEQTRHIECFYTNPEKCAQKLDCFVKAYLK